MPWLVIKIRGNIMAPMKVHGNAIPCHKSLKMYSVDILFDHAGAIGHAMVSTIPSTYHCLGVLSWHFTMTMPWE